MNIWLLSGHFIFYIFLSRVKNWIEAFFFEKKKFYLVDFFSGHLTNYLSQAIDSHKICKIRKLLWSLLHYFLGCISGENIESEADVVRRSHFTIDSLRKIVESCLEINFPGWFKVWELLTGLQCCASCFVTSKFFYSF